MLFLGGVGSEGKGPPNLLAAGESAGGGATPSPPASTWTTGAAPQHSEPALHPPAAKGHFGSKTFKVLFEGGKGGRAKSLKNLGDGFAGIADPDGYAHTPSPRLINFFRLGSLERPLIIRSGPYPPLQGLVVARVR